MTVADLKRIRGRLAAERADVEGMPSAHEFEGALEEIEALWNERGRQADQLVKERERHAALFDRAPFACMITDIHGNVRDANLAAVALLAVPAAYLAGKPLAIFIHEEERGSFRMHLANAASHLRTPVEAWRTRIKSAGGKPREVKVDLRPMPPDEENSLPLLWFLRDTE